MRSTRPCSPYGGFDHNAQALRIVTKLERRYAEFDGLNLTWETLEGLVKHNGPLLGADGKPTGHYAGRELPQAIAEYDALHDLRLDLFAGPEAQAAALADDIAYNAHDIDDGLRAGLFDFAQIGRGRLSASAHRATSTRAIRGSSASAAFTSWSAASSPISSRMRSPRAPRGSPRAAFASADDVRLAGRTLLGFSAPMAQAQGAIKRFLFANMYRHPGIKRIRVEAAGVVRDLFAIFYREPELMPAEWASLAITRGAEDEAKMARIVCDYIAGMTDRYALAEHQRLFDETPELR